MNSLVRAVIAGLCLLAAGAGHAQERFAVKPGFAFPADRPSTVVVYRPDVHVGSLTTGGIEEPNADWTAEARGLLADALKADGRVAGARLVFAEEPEGDDADYLAQYRALFSVVAGSIMEYKLFPGGRLPTKKKVFDWTLGGGVERLGRMTGADYALFMFTRDAYGSAGRKTAQIVGLLLGVYMPAGVHLGYAGLVDLKTGDVVWLNADPQMGGDVRTSEGAAKRVTQLLEGLPGRAPAAGAAIVAAK